VYLGFFFAFVPFVVTVYEFYDFMNRKKSDIISAFSIGRLHLIFAHYITAVITVVSSMIISFGIFYTRIIFFESSRGTVLEICGFKTTTTFLMAFLVSLVFAIISINITSFFFVRANTVADGCICSFMWGFFLYIIRNVICGNLNCFDSITRETEYFIRTINYKYLVPGWNTVTLFSKCHYIHKEKNAFEIAFMTEKNLIPCAILLVFSILCFVGICVLAGSKRNENIGGMSNSWFSYKLLIPVCGILLSTLVTRADKYVSTAFLVIAMLIGYFIYRRSLKLHKSDIIMTVIVAILSMIEIRL
jgi:hypothetical protein